MPRLRPAPEKWVRAFDEAMPAFQGAQRRTMFGYACVFVGGNMAAGLHEQGLILRLPEPLRERLVAAGGTPFQPMPGRIMREYVVAADDLAERPAEVRWWLEQSLSYVAALPPKEPGR